MQARRTACFSQLSPHASVQGRARGAEKGGETAEEDDARSTFRRCAHQGYGAVVYTRINMPFLRLGLLLDFRTNADACYASN